MSKTPTEKSFEDDGYECYNPVCSAFRQEMTEKYSSLKVLQKIFFCRYFNF